jgi:hypothetical protein
MPNWLLTILKLIIGVLVDKMSIPTARKLKEIYERIKIERQNKKIKDEYKDNIDILP